MQIMQWIYSKLQHHFSYPVHGVLYNFFAHSVVTPSIIVRGIFFTSDHVIGPEEILVFSPSHSIW